MVVKYRDRVASNQMLALASFLFVIFTFSYGRHDHRLKRFVQEIVTPQYDTGLPVFEDVVFTKNPPPRRSKALTESKNDGEIFKRHRGFTNYTLEQKLAVWENEYVYRSTNYHMQLKNKLFTLLMNHGGADPVVIDSGAHVGDTSIPMMQRVIDYGRTDVRLVMVEPDESKCLWIRRKLLDLNRTDSPGIAEMVYIVNAGIWSHQTTARLNRDVGHPGSWTVETDEYALRDHMKIRGNTVEGFKRGDIQMFSVGDIIKKETNLALFHLDAEGSEARAILGLLRTEQRPTVVYESRKKNNPDFLFEKNMLGYLGGYKQVERVGENSDRVMVHDSVFAEGGHREMPVFT